MSDSDERERLFHERRQWRECRDMPKLAIVVCGPRRDYDFALFCCDHNVEAEECAAEWTAAIIDDLESGESGDFRIEVRPFVDGADECCVCDPPENEP